MRSKKKILMTSMLALLSAGMLTSCDYSNFSLFGLFYNIYENAVEEGYKKTDNVASSSSSASSDDTPSTETFVPQAYRVTSSSTIDSGTLNTTQQLSLLPNNLYSLIYYQRLVKSDNTESTYLSYGMYGSYTRTGNVVSLDYSTSTYTNRSSANTLYINGTTEEFRKESFNKVYNSETPSFVVKSDGTFSLGTSDSSTEVATGISTANTYFYLDTVGRKSYKMISLIDDTNYFAVNFSLDSKNNEQPVSNLVVYGQYTRYDDKKTDEYEYIKIGMGRGHMYASNNGSDMEFDITTDESFTQWWGMSIGSVRSMKITKTGYTTEAGDKVDAYSFELLDTELDGGDPTPEEPTKEAMIELKGKKNEAITLSLYKDGTYIFAWAANKVEETGTWKYDASNDRLNLTCGETVQYFSLNEDETAYTINYKYTINDALNQEYEITTSQWDSLFRVVIALKGDKNAAITLDLYVNGTYTFAWAANHVEETGTWTYDGSKDVLTLSAGTDHSITSTKNADGTYKIPYVYSVNDQLTQNYTISKSTWDATFARTLATLKGLTNEKLTLTIASNKTYNFHYEITNSGQTFTGDEAGTYSYDSSKDILTFSAGADHSITSTKNADGTYSIAYVYSKNSSLTQNYQIDAENWSVITGNSELTLTGQAVSETTMTFKADNTYTFHYVVQNGQYSGDEVGIWSYDSTNDSVTLTSGEKTNTLSKQEDGSYKLSYVAAINSGLTQDFVTYEQAFRSTFKHHEVECDTSKTSPANPYFYFNSDGSYEFGFATYHSGEKGTWSYDEANDIINLVCYGKTNSFTKQEDGSYTCNYLSNTSSMMTFDHFILTAIKAETLLNKTAVKIDKTNTSGTKFSFTFYKNHVYKFSFDTYNFSEYGVWSYDSTNDKFTFVCNNTTNYATKQNDGTYKISYISNTNSQLTQDYTLPAADATTLIALA